MEKNNDLMSGKGEKGQWITVNGSHIFIEDGQSVEDAMEKHFEKRKAHKELYPDIAQAGEDAVDRHMKLTEGGSKRNENATIVSYDEFKIGRDKIGLDTTNKDYNDYLERIKNSSHNGKYTGDNARFNDLYSIYDKHDKLIQSGKYNDCMTSDVEDALRKLDINQEGILRFWEDTNRPNIKGADDAVSVAMKLSNDGLYRNGVNYSESELNEKLREAKINSERAKAKLLISDERAKAEHIDKTSEKEKYYQANQDIEYLTRALKGYNR